MDLTTQTPREIDAALAAIWERANKHFQAWWLAEADAHEAKRKGEREAARLGGGNPETLAYWRETEAHHLQKAETERAAALATRQESTPYEAEFRRRGGWTRYYLVVSSPGHIHRERECSTCRDRTLYRWLFELSDCDESEMVRQHGVLACTTCFPNAPTLPGYEAKDDGTCPNKVPTDPSPENRLYRYGSCAHCGARGVNVTKAGNLRKHKRGA